MKRAWMSLAAAVITIPLLSSCTFRFSSVDGYNFDWRGETATRQESGTIAAEVQLVEVDNRFGNVRVEVADGEPSWSWELTCWSDTVEEADQFTSQIQLQFNEDPKKAHWQLVMPEPPVPQLHGVRSHLTLRVPKIIHVNVKNGFGDTAIRGIQGSTTVKSRHGNLELFDLAESVEAANEHGSIKAERIQGGTISNRHGPIHLRSIDGNAVVDNQHGEVNVEGVQGDLQVDNQHGNVVANRVTQSVKIETAHAAIELNDCGGDATLTNQHGRITARRVFGSLEVRNQHATTELDVASESVMCTSQHGKVVLRLRNPELSTVQAETSFGDLRVELPEEIPLAVEADVEFGDVHSAVPVIVAGTGSESSLGEAMPRVFLKNRHGDIRVTRFSPLDTDL